MKSPTYFLPTYLSYPTPYPRHHTITTSHTPQNSVFGPLRPLILRPALGPASVQRRPLRRRRRHLPKRQVLPRLLRDSQDRPVPTGRGCRAEHRRRGPGGEGAGDESRDDLCGLGSDGAECYGVEGGASVRGGLRTTLLRWRMFDHD